MIRLTRLWMVMGVLVWAGAAFARTDSFFMAAPQAAGGSPFSVTASAVPDRMAPEQEGTLSVTLTSPEGYKVYADALSVVPETVPGVSFGPARAPASVEKQEPDGKTARFYVGKAEFRIPFRIGGSASAGRIALPVGVHFRGCSEVNCFFPETRRVEAEVSVTASAFDAGKEAPVRTDAPERENPYAGVFRKFGFFGVLAGAFIWGIFASLTPCVYPMIPVTMSVIGATRAKTMGRSLFLSVIYVFGMSLTYAFLGVTAAWTGGLFGALADHPAVHILVAGVLVVLALSMFDVFYFQIPAFLSERIGFLRGPGPMGVFLTGAAAGLLVGPCVGPMLVSLLLYIAATGSKVKGFLMMWSFSLGMGGLFLLVGTFSGAAASLPKAGNWTVRIKQAFGVLMLFMALHYLRPVLSPDVFRLCLGGILIGLGVFLGAMDRIEAGSPGYGKFWKSAGILCLALGVAYASRFALEDGSSAGRKSPPKPSDLSWRMDEPAAIAEARQKGLPVLIDFYADWCAACVDLDRKSFSHPEVSARSSRFVLIRVDQSDPEEPSAAKLREKYGVIGLPTLVFLDGTGRVLKDQTITEFIGPEALLSRMRQVENMNRGG